MKRIGAVVGASVVGFIIFAIAAGVVAALLSAIAQTGWSPAPNVSSAIGLLLDVLKWSVAIWGGYRAYILCGEGGSPRRIKLATL